jgi:hypothetical protein
MSSTYYTCVTGDGDELFTGFQGTIEQARAAAKRHATALGSPVFLHGPEILIDEDTDESIGEEVMPEQAAYVVLVGNPVDGFSVVGPFDSHEDAKGFCQGSDETWWIAKLEKPGD